MILIAFLLIRIYAGEGGKDFLGEKLSFKYLFKNINSWKAVC